MANIRSSRKGGGGGTFSSIVDSVITDSKSQMDGLDFLESPSGPRISLLPVQRFLFKCIVGIPLEKGERMIPVWDDFRENIICTLSERDFLKYIHDKGRCNFYDWRDLPERGFNEVEILAGRRGGKALALDTPVPTPQGFTTMGALKTGDTVLGPDGHPTQVVLAHEPFSGTAYRLTFDDGSSVVAHEDHLWFTETKTDRKTMGRRIDPATASRPASCKGLIPLGAVRTTKEIAETLVIPRPDGKAETNHSIPVANAVEAPERELPLDPYWFGCWLGDGHSHKAGVTTMDEEIVRCTYAVAEAHGLQVTVAQKPDNKASSYMITTGKKGPEKGTFGYKKGHVDPRNKVWFKLHQLGVLRNKHIPEAYLWASAEQRLALLQGLMDTDGSCSTARGRCEFSSSEERLSRGVYHLAASLGLKPTFTTHRSFLNGKAHKPRHRVVWTSSLPVFRLERKLKYLPSEANAISTRRFIVAAERLEGAVPVRCITVARQDGLFLFGHNFNITHNSFLLSALALEKLRQLLGVRNPHEIYRIADGDPIDFTILAQDEDGAGRLYDKIKMGVNKAEFFRPFTWGKPGTDSMQFITEADRHRRNVEPSIQIAAWACTTRAARGPSSFFLALDEFAHFRSASGASSDEVYEAATPATARFLRKEGGKEYLDSLIVTITSPWTKVGKSYELYKEAMADGKDASLFVYQCSTAEMAGEEISPTYLRNKYKRDPVKWQCEHGGKFLESSGTAWSVTNLMACVDKGRKNAWGFNPRRAGITYFWGCDLGFKKDATALAICHWEQTQKGDFVLVYDYIDRMIVGEGEWENAHELDLEAILDWFEDMNQWLPGRFGVIDQYAGAMFTQLCTQRGLSFIELVHLTEAINSEAGFAIQGYINQGIARFPDVEKFIHEMGTVEAYYVGKHRIKIESPSGEKNAHDDMYDAVALAAWKAQKWMMEDGGKGFAYTGQAIQVGGEELRPGDLGVDLETASMAQLRVNERMKALERLSAARQGTMPMNARMSARRGRF